MLKSLTIKQSGKNSIEEQLVWKNLEIKIKFLVIEGTHKKFDKEKVLRDEGRDLEPEFKIKRPGPSPIIICQGHYIAKEKDRVEGLVVTWCEATESTS